MKNIFVTGVIILQLLVAATVLAAEKTKTAANCHMDFSLKGWSVFYKTAEGYGRVTCSNGQRTNVKINVTGGGLSFGKMEILNGKGSFSEVLNIDEIFGEYIAAEVHAGRKSSLFLYGLLPDGRAGKVDKPGFQPLPGGPGKDEEEQLHRMPHRHVRRPGFGKGFHAGPAKETGLGPVAGPAGKDRPGKGPATSPGRLSHFK